MLGQVKRYEQYWPTYESVVAATINKNNEWKQKTGCKERNHFNGQTRGRKKKANTWLVTVSVTQSELPYVRFPLAHYKTPDKRSSSTFNTHTLIKTRRVDTHSVLDAINSQWILQWLALKYSAAKRLTGRPIHTPNDLSTFIQFAYVHAHTSNPT